MKKPDILLPFQDWQHLSRRGFLLTATALAASCALPPLKGPAGTPACILATEQEEGPFYIDGAKLRRDITEGKPGVPLRLRVALVDARTCRPIPNAAIDIWHCDAGGLYSGFTANNPTDFAHGHGPGPDRPPPPGGPRRHGPRKTDTTRFLRGVQLTDRNGMVEFSTLYPGWYLGRAIHIHLKTHLGGAAAADTYRDGHVAHTGQLFFPEDVTERVARMQPYAKHPGVHRTTQEEDGIYTDEHGSASLMRLEKLGRSDEDGFIAAITLAVDPTLTPPPVRGGPGGPLPAG